MTCMAYLYIVRLQKTLYSFSASNLTKNKMATIGNLAALNCPSKQKKLKQKFIIHCFYFNHLVNVNGE